MNGILDNVKVGDKLLVTSMWAKRIVTVEKVLKANIIAGGSKYRKSTGYKYPIDAWNITSARPATEEDIENVSKEIARNMMLAGCRKINFDNLTDTQLEQILEIVNPKTEKDGKI
jgi:hypothetical protein